MWCDVCVRVRACMHVCVCLSVCACVCVVGSELYFQDNTVLCTLTKVFFVLKLIYKIHSLYAVLLYLNIQIIKNEIILCTTLLHKFYL